MERFAEAEKDLREGRITASDLEESVEWDFSSYSGTSEVDTYDGQNARQDKGTRWVCPGRGKVIQGRRCAQCKFYHKKSCIYYAAPEAKTYDHESCRRLCRVFPGSGAKRRFSAYFAEETGSAGKRKKKKREAGLRRFREKCVRGKICPSARRKVFLLTAAGNP